MHNQARATPRQTQSFGLGIAVHASFIEKPQSGDNAAMVLTRLGLTI
jgi:hypothetical protein